MLYLEDYLEMIEHLPQELRDRFTEMREMDLSVQNSMDTLEKRVRTLFGGCRRGEVDTDQANTEFSDIKRGERQENEASQGEYPGTSRPRPSHSRRGGVKLRVRRPARYNEDSEEDSALAISKRAPRHSQQHHQRRRHHALQSAATEAAMEAGARLALRHEAGTSHAPVHTDHDYINGHSSHAHNGEGGVSISSRGRVRKLTAKARGLLRD